MRRRREKKYRKGKTAREYKKKYNIMKEGKTSSNNNIFSLFSFISSAWYFDYKCRLINVSFYVPQL